MDALDPFLAAKIENWFTYHPPTEEQRKRYERLREAYRTCALEVAICTPIGADQTAALRMLRESCMTANASIACEEAKPK